MKQTQTIEYKPEAIKESVEFYKNSTRHEEWAQEALAKILEIVRAKVDPNSQDKQSDLAFVRQVCQIFPE